MNDWKPYETAPPDIPVVMGGWEFYGGVPRWIETVGVARTAKRTWFGTKIVNEFYSCKYSYWRPVPAPPTT